MDMKVGNQPMQIITYKNLAGRTGRPQYDTTGESIILCIDEVELRDYKKKYFESDIGELDSGLQYFLKKRPNPRYAVQSQILQIASNTKRSSNKEIVNNMRKTWFWKKSTNEDKSKFVKGIDIELWNLRNYGYIRGPNEDFELTYYGKYAKNVMLTPFTLRNLISNTRRILEAKRDQEEKTILLLSLVGLPTELSNIDPFIKKIKTDKKYEFVLDVLYQDDILTEPTERIKNCPKFAKILWEWINEEPIEDILENNNLDKTADSALLEEILPQNSFWILNTIKDIPDSLIDMEALDREYLDFLAQSCKYGSLDTLHHEFRNLDLKYLGRQSIILLVDYMKRNLLNIEDLTETDFLDVFSNNKESAKKAFNELQFTLKNT
jgi:replicative superfamily II helicase